MNTLGILFGQLIQMRQKTLQQRGAPPSAPFIQGKDEHSLLLPDFSGTVVEIRHRVNGEIGGGGNRRAQDVLSLRSQSGMSPQAKAHGHAAAVVEAVSYTHLTLPTILLV